MQNPVFSKRYLIVNEVFNAVTHGIGFALSVFGFVLLMIKGAHTHSTLDIVAYTIYGITMMLLFLFSTLFHSLIFTKAKKVFQIFDHSSIYLLIAGSYTPYCLLAIKGTLGWTLFVVIWLMAILGIVYKSLWLGKKTKLSLIIYILMGWLCVIAFQPLLAHLGQSGTLLLAAGGVAYTVGAIFYSFQNVKFMHVVWHLFVMLGAGLMYFSVLLYT